MLMFGLFFLSFASAENIATSQVNTEIQITNYCKVATCTYMNLTSITSPNGSVVYYNDAMTKNVQEFNYTYNATEIGTYTFKTCGDPGDVVVCDSDSFTITNNGSITPDGLPIFQGIFLLIIFGTACFLLYLSSAMSETGFKIFFLITSMIFLMSTIITGYMISSDGNVTASINATTLALIIVLGSILIIMFVYMLIRQTINALDLYRIKTGREWKVNPGRSVGGFDTRKAY